MTELALRRGDYVPDGIGGVVRAEGAEAVLEQVRFRLTARRGTFPFYQDLGSRLWQLGRLSPAARGTAAKQYVAEALADMDLAVEAVELTDRGGTADVHVTLTWQGQSLQADLEVRM